MTENAKTDDDWYYAELKASETGIVDPDELAAMKRQMTDAQYDQEMECSFTAPVLGTYYAGQIQTLEKKGHIYSPHADYDPNYAVSMVMDLGFTDSTAIWFWQPKPDGFSIIDYEEAHSQPLSYYFDLFESKPYTYDTVWLPHDARAKTLQTGRSTIEQFLEQGLPARIVPHLKVQQGIDAGRLILNDCYFNEKTKQGVEGLRAYRRRFNEVTKVFSDAPLHDWACLEKDTLIQTPTGSKPISDFAVGDNTLTCGKVGKVTRAGVVKYAELVDIILSNDKKITCTPEHKFFTRLGLVMAKDLCYTDVLLQQKDVAQWLASKDGIRRAFTESFKASGTTTGLSAVFMLAKSAVSKLCYIGSFMKHPALYPKPTQSCHSEVGKILVPVIGCVDPTQITADISWLCNPTQSLKGLNIISTQWVNTTTTLEQTQRKMPYTALSAPTTTVRYPKGSTFITSTLTTLTTIARTLLRSQKLTIRSYTLRKRKEPVYDICVDIDHAYTLADSDVVTSNSNPSDAFRYFALVCQKSEAVPLEEKRHLDDFTSKEYSLDNLFKDRESGSSQIAKLRM